MTSTKFRTAMQPCDEIVHTDWFKIVMWLGTANPSALFLNSSPMLLYNLVMTFDE